MIIEYSIRMAGAGGFEPPSAGTKTLCLASWRRPNTLYPPFIIEDDEISYAV